MMEALHEVAHDTLIARMQKDLKEYGIEGEWYDPSK
jgi:hypothetical protein